MLAENVENLIYIAALFAACVKLSVGESACSAFAKRIVRFRIYHMISADEGDVFSAFVYRLSTLHNDRANAKFDKLQGSE